MDKIYDALVLGGGPAGVMASIYLKRGGKDVAIIERMEIGGQLNSIAKISNYPGFIDESGMIIAQQFLKQVKSLDIPIIFNEVIDVDFSGEIKILKTRRDCYKAKSIILSMGGNPKELEIEGEKEFKGRGVSYCVECDGNFFKGKDVAIYGSNNMAVDGAMYLSNLCSKVYFLHRFEIENLDLTALKRKSNIEMINNVLPIKIQGNERLEKFIFMQNEKEKELRVDGVFIVSGNKPNTLMLKGKIELSPDGFILCDENMHTSVSGVFACGDIRKSSLKQVSTAIGEGAIAGVEAIKFLTHVGEMY